MGAQFIPENLSDLTERSYNSLTDTPQGFADSKDPTGWVDGDNIDVAYDAINRTVTLTGDLTYQWRGVRNTDLVSPWTSPAHDAGDGEFFLYSTDGVNFAWSTVTWLYDSLQVSKVSINTAGNRVFAIHETHGLMPWTSHRADHTNTGTYRISGGTPDPATYTVNTATDAANSPSFFAAVVRDEDLATAIVGVTEGTYTTLRIGAGGVATFDTTATLPFRSSGSYLLYNTPSTGAETAASNLRYLNVYQILIPVTSDADSQKFRMVFLQPQAQYSSLALAQAEDYRALSLGDLALASNEFVAFTRITYTTLAGDANTGKCRIATGGISYLTGSRASQVSVTGFSALSGSNVILTAPSGTGTLPATVTDVEKFKEAVDALPIQGWWTGIILAATKPEGLIDTQTWDDLTDKTGQHYGWIQIPPVPDTTSPEVTAFTLPATSEGLTVNVTTFTATDNVAVTGYLITESATPPVAGVGAWSASAPATFTASGFGAKTMYAWAKDAAGNISAVFASQSVTFNIAYPYTVADNTLLDNGFTARVAGTAASIVVPSADVYHLDSFVYGADYNAAPAGNACLFKAMPASAYSIACKIVNTAGAYYGNAAVQDPTLITISSDTAAMPTSAGSVDSFPYRKIMVAVRTNNSTNFQYVTVYYSDATNVYSWNGSAWVAGGAPISYNTPLNGFRPTITRNADNSYTILIKSADNITTLVNCTTPTNVLYGTAADKIAIGDYIYSSAGSTYLHNMDITVSEVSIT